MQDLQAKNKEDLKKKELLRRIWESPTPPPPPLLSSSENSIWRSGNGYNTYSSSTVNVSQQNPPNFLQVGFQLYDNSYVVDNYLYATDSSFSSPETLNSFQWPSYQFLGDTVSASTRRQVNDQQDLLSVLNQGMSRESISDTFTDPLSDFELKSASNGVNSNNNGVNGVPSSSIQNDSLWFSTTPLRETDVVEMSKHRWLTDSVGFVRCNPFYSLECAMKSRYLTVMIENIPWLISENEIKRNFVKFKQPSQDKLVQNIHIIMDTSTGKTESKAFIQLIDCDENRRLLEENHNTHVLLSRRITYSICSEDELLKALYPKWPGTFQNGVALLPEDYDNNSSNAGNHCQSPLFITQRELQSLGNICKMYKLNFNRKSGERPFSCMMSIVLNLPWHQERIVTTAQRDIIYESYKIIAKYLAQHVTKQHTPFDSDSLNRFVRPALQCCGFTPKQRKAILNEAGVTCPPELAYSVMEPPPMPQVGQPFTTELLTEQQSTLYN